MNARRRIRTRARKGVTLMELMVALTITGFMAIVGTATFTSIIDNRHLLRESTAPTESSAALRETLRQWILPATIQVQATGVPRGNNSNVRMNSSNIATRTQNGAEGVTAAAVNGDELRFTTTAPNPTNSTMASMRLFIDEDDNTPEKGLTLEYQNTPTAQTLLERRQLDSTIVGMTIEYLNGQNNQWVTAERSAGIRARAVRLTLLPAEGANVPAILSLPMVFTIGQAINPPNATPTR
jgi:prepilin-type N-terminal cleavage/methylation domain-containing protein